jgi:carbon storage regulator
MLVLSRKIGERVFLDDTITLTVVDIDGGRVRLGIEAPPTVSIKREELVKEDEAVSSPSTSDSAPTRLSSARPRSGGNRASRR